MKVHGELSFDVFDVFDNCLLQAPPITASMV